MASTTDGCAFSVSPQGRMIFQEQAGDPPAQPLPKPQGPKDQFVRGKRADEEFQELSRQLEQQRKTRNQIQALDDSTKKLMEEREKTAFQVRERLMTQFPPAKPR